MTLAGDAFRTAIPFEVLPLEEQVLGMSAAVEHLPSLSLGLLLAQRVSPPMPPAHDALLMASGTNASKAGGKVAGPVPPEALQSIAEQYGPREARLLVNEDATLAMVRRRSGAAQVLQFLTHGRYDASRERAACLLLTPESGANDGYVGANEIEGIAAGTAALDAPAVVLLTACGSGRAPLRLGDGGASDLAGAFFLASTRTRCVLTSSFDLEVEATRRLSVAFHRVLRAGAGPAEALRQARVDLAADELLADPFYHSLVRVVGMGHAPVFEPPR